MSSEPPVPAPVVPLPFLSRATLTTYSGNLDSVRADTLNGQVAITGTFYVSDAPGSTFAITGDRQADTLRFRVTIVPNAFPAAGAYLLEAATTNLTPGRYRVRLERSFPWIPSELSRLDTSVVLR